MKIKKGDTVTVIAGKDKGKTGAVVATFASVNKVVVEGVNVAKKHEKNKRSRSNGQIIEKSMPVSASSVALMEGGKAVRVGYKFEGEGKDRKKVRISKASGKTI